MRRSEDPAELSLYPAFAARAAGVPLGVIMRDNRVSRVARARQAAMVVAFENGFNVSQIARAFERDRATVKHALRRFGYNG